jgi:hypothetical protein
MQKDGGISFTCVQSSAWRKDSRCSESPSDFMTAGEHFGQIPPVPKGFVRWVQLSNINKLSARNRARTDRNMHYIYCGDGNVVPDTAGWAPFGAELAAAMAHKLGSQKISSMRIPPSDPNRMSVERCLRENPILKSAGVTLDDFSFSNGKQSSTAQLAPLQATAPIAEQASPVPVQAAFVPSLEEATSTMQPSAPALQVASCPPFRVRVMFRPPLPLPVVPVPTPAASLEAAEPTLQPSASSVQQPSPEVPLPLSLEAAEPTLQPNASSVQQPSPEVPLPLSLEAAEPTLQPSASSVQQPTPVVPVPLSLKAAEPTLQPSASSVQQPSPEVPLPPSLEAAAPSVQPARLAPLPPVSVASAAHPRLNLDSFCFDRCRYPSPPP